VPKGITHVRLVVLVALAAGAFFAWRALFPTEERRIRARIGELEETVNASPSADGVGRLADAARLLSYFTDDVVIEPGAPYTPIRGRHALVAVLHRAAEPGGFSLAFEDLSVTLAPSGSEAAVTMTATLTWTNSRTGERTVDAREIEVDLRKVNDEWQIAAARAVQTLERPSTSPF
jgi:ketosteroid isomerase-like protein